MWLFVIFEEVCYDVSQRPNANSIHSCNEDFLRYHDSITCPSLMFGGTDKNITWKLKLLTQPTKNKGFAYNFSELENYLPHLWIWDDFGRFVLYRIFEFNPLNAPRLTVWIWNKLLRRFFHFFRSHKRNFASSVNIWNNENLGNFRIILLNSQPNNVAKIEFC